MIELWDVYWPIILVGLLIGIAVGYLLFRPRQRITLSSDTPVRPHMGVRPDMGVRADQPPRVEGRGVAAEAARATGDVAGQLLGANVSAQLPTAGGDPDNLLVMKGVGPKLAAMLNALGLTRFDQLAGLSSGQVDAIDAELGAFRGRLKRDRIVEQAHYLARGDLDGYRQNFGAL